MTQALTLHRGLDYACIMREGDTTDTALVQVKYPTDEDLALLQQMAAAPQLLGALKSAVAWDHNGRPWLTEARDAICVAEQQP